MISSLRAICVCSQQYLRDFSGETWIALLFSLTAIIDSTSLGLKVTFPLYHARFAVEFMLVLQLAAACSPLKSPAHLKRASMEVKTPSAEALAQWQPFHPAKQHASVFPGLQDSISNALDAASALQSMPEGSGSAVDFIRDAVHWPGYGVFPANVAAARVSRQHSFAHGPNTLESCVDGAGAIGLGNVYGDAVSVLRDTNDEDVFGGLSSWEVSVWLHVSCARVPTRTDSLLLWGNGRNGAAAGCRRPCSSSKSEFKPCWIAAQLKASSLQIQPSCQTWSGMRIW